MTDTQSPKAGTQVLTLEGFLRWCAGEPLRAEDFKKDARQREAKRWARAERELVAERARGRGRTFDEEVYILPGIISDTVEIMIDSDSEGGQVIDVYTYADSIHEIDEAIIAAGGRWRSKLNSCFLHAENPEAAARELKLRARGGDSHDASM